MTTQGAYCDCGAEDGAGEAMECPRHGWSPQMSLEPENPRRFRYLWLALALGAALWLSLYIGALCVWAWVSPWL